MKGGVYGLHTGIEPEAQLHLETGCLGTGQAHDEEPGDDLRLDRRGGRSEKSLRVMPGQEPMSRMCL